MSLTPGEILDRQRQAREFAIFNAELKRKEAAEAAARDLRNKLRENEAARMKKAIKRMNETPMEKKARERIEALSKLNPFDRAIKTFFSGFNR